MINKNIVTEYLNEIVPDAHCELNFKNGYQLLIAVILSAQATDKSVNKVTPALFKKYKNFEELAKGKIKDVESLIKEIGLSSIKSKRIIDVSKTIVKDYGSKIPNTFEELTSIKGIGRKTANVILIELFNKQAFPVDTHINRIAHQLKIANKNDDVVKTETKLVKFFKDEDFKLLHHQLISFGRYFCTAKNPNCENCKLKKYCKK